MATESEIETFVYRDVTSKLIRRSSVLTVRFERTLTKWDGT